METMETEKTETPAAEAETVTQEPVEEPPSQPADRLAELEQTISQGFGKIAQILATHQEQINELTRSPEPETAPPAESPRPRELPDGVVRFFSKFKDYGVWKRPAIRTLVDGKLHIDPGHFLEFTNGILDTDDQEIIDFLRNHTGAGVGIGVDYFEDPFAQPHAGVEVKEGPRTSDRSPRTKPSELAARI
jgi:hypothetical protein